MKCVNLKYTLYLVLLQEHVKECEVYVSNHQHYHDTYIQTREWLQGLTEKLDVCTEPAADKHSVQNKLDRLQVGQILNSDVHYSNIIK